jgi:hypothetical protein
MNTLSSALPGYFTSSDGDKNQPYIPILMIKK